MERLTYVTEDGTVLFSPDGKDAVTITDISAMGDTEYLEQIADTLANREIAAMFYERKYNEVCNELKEYRDTGLAPEQVRELAEKKQSRREWYQKGYADGKKDAENDRWIPVEERLPEEVDERQDILILLSSGRMVVANYVKTANKGKIFFDGYDMFHPVAWQPLPDPYCPVNKTEMPDWK